MTNPKPKTQNPKPYILPPTPYDLLPTTYSLKPTFSKFKEITKFFLSLRGMDSLTQIVLGAAVGEAVLGRKIGNKAIYLGALGGTIPDFDVAAGFFTDTVSALEFHRGITHSLVFAVGAGLLFAWLCEVWDKRATVKQWWWFWFLCFFTHPLLDAHTTWGTQLFWPLEWRV
ncbi:MAG TPA: metal-dependent hydrolase, partial [Flavobacteriaceae bacterium]|nr:metal-dependent hydrolase [Flavobacteriaceae bacterium]